jgi:hypothetical protein
MLFAGWKIGSYPGSPDFGQNNNNSFRFMGSIRLRIESQGSMYRSCEDHGLIAASARSTRRRIASERLILCSLANFESRSIVSRGNLVAIEGSRPVAGLPRGRFIGLFT